MAYDIDWSSIYGSNSGGSYLGNYDNFSLGSSGNESYLDTYTDTAYQDDSWYTDSFLETEQYANNAANANVDMSSNSSTWLDDVWGWANTEVGSRTIAGGLGMLADLWGEEAKAKIGYDYGKGGSSANRAAELENDRIEAHNKSINEPVDMGLGKFKRT